MTHAQGRLITRACHVQIERHVAPLWRLEPRPVRYYTKRKYAPADSTLIAILEDSDAAEAHGYHDETPEGRAYGRVFTRHVLDDGGSLYETPYSVSAILSHEVIEAFIDPDLNLWAEGKPGKMYAYEACDPVQEDAYRIRVDGTWVHVSNFVTPAWFDLENPKDARYDYMGHLDKPFARSPGGYTIFWDGGTQEKILRGRRTRRSRSRPEKNHPAARSYRRTRGRLHF